MQLGAGSVPAPNCIQSRLGRALEVFDVEVHGDLCVELPDL